MTSASLNHGLATSAEWAARIAALERESGEAEQQLAQARRQRVNADADAVLHGKSRPRPGQARSRRENQAQRRVQALAAAIAMARAQLVEAQETERIVEEKRLAELRTALATEIVSSAQRVDRLRAERPATPPDRELLSQLRAAGGQTPFVALK